MKNIKWKELLIDHCEKIFFGVIGLFVLVSIGTAKWGSYERQPDEFTEKVTKGKQNFGVSRWSDEKQAEFAAANVGDKVNLVLTKPSAREYSTRWVWPMNKKKEKIREPEYKGLLEPYADAGRLLVELTPAAPNTPNGVDVVIATDDEIKKGTIGDVPQPRGGVDGPRVDAPRGNTPGNNNLGTTPNGLDDSTSDATSSAAIGTTPTGMGSGGAAYAASAPSNHGIADGRYFVAFRAVFPMKEQVDKIRQALNLETNAEAVRLVEFWDFELERQTARSGADPWSGPWEPVDIQYAINLLDRVQFDIDVVSEQYRDSGITMPLPYRVTGDWKFAAGPTGLLLASHPRIGKLLSEKEALEEEARTKALLEATKKKTELQNSSRGGFNKVQHDTKSMQNAVRGNSDMMNSFNSSFGAMMGMEDDAKGDMGSGSGGMPAMPGLSGNMGGNMGSSNGMMQQGNFAQVVQISELLLFRFLDFQIVPGNAYRYRARLVLKNPNFQRDASELLDVTSREGQFRKSEWSVPSTPAIVHDNVEFYVNKVKASKNDTSASIDVFQWMKETGSYVKGHFENLHAGDQIAVSKSDEEAKKSARAKKEDGMETLVLRPLEQTYAKEFIDYVTPNTLVDVERTMLINPKDYPELALTPKVLTLTLDEIVMLNRFGELESKNNASQDGKYDSAKKLMTQQESVWAALIKQSEVASQPASGLAGLLGGGMNDAMGSSMDGMNDGMMDAASGSGGRKSSAGKKGGRGQSAPGMSGSAF